MSAPNYDATMVKPVKWATIAEAQDGSWRAFWLISFSKRVNSEPPGLEMIARQCDDSFFGFRVDLLPVDHCRIQAVVTTVHWSMDDPYYFLTYRMFAAIESGLGPINSIEGQPRDWWWPFRQVEPLSLEQWRYQVLALRAAASPEGAP